MSDYTKNNKKTEWVVNQEEGTAKLNVDHGDHTHQLDLGQVPIDEITENPNKFYGDAHRASPHYPKNENKQKFKKKKINEIEDEDFMEFSI